MSKYDCDTIFDLWYDQGIKIQAIAQKMKMTESAVRKLMKLCNIPGKIKIERIKEDWFFDKRNRKIVIMKLRRAGIPATVIMKIMGIENESVYMAILREQASVQANLEISDLPNPHLDYWKRPNITVAELVYCTQVLNMGISKIAKVYGVDKTTLQYMAKKYNIKYRKFAKSPKYRNLRLLRKKIMKDIIELKERSLLP